MIPDSVENLTTTLLAEQLQRKPISVIYLFSSIAPVVTSLEAECRIYAYTVMGVALRMEKHYDASESFFRLALGVNDLEVGSSAIEAIISREYAGLALRVGDLENAKELVESALDFTDEGDPKEHFASLSYRGQLLQAAGDKQDALEVYRYCDSQLRELNAPCYELQNLAFYLSALPRWHALKMIPRLLRLIRRCGQSRRYTEVFVRRTR